MRGAFKSYHTHALSALLTRPPSSHSRDREQPAARLRKNGAKKRLIQERSGLD
jgi:hypothetical protein